MYLSYPGIILESPALQADSLPSQVGLIPGMKGFFNIGKSVNVKHHINKPKNKTHVIVSTDAEKVYQFMTKTLQKVDLESIPQCNKGHK